MSAAASPRPGLPVPAAVSDAAVTGVPRAALIALVVVAVAFVAVVVATTPWRPLPDLPGGGVPVDPGRDFSLAQRAVIAAYQQRIVPVVLVATAVGLVVSLVLGLTPLGARLVELAGRPFGGSWPAQVLAGGLLLLVVGRVVVLPFDLWATAIRRDAGLVRQPWGSWALDQAKAFGIGAALTLAGLLVLVWLARSWPRTWWAPAAAGAAALVVLGSFLVPVVFEPLFAKFTPMPASPLRTELLALAARDGVPVSDVLVSDASARTTALNAYVSGFGSTRRIVVYDTLLQSQPDEVVRSVVAHELGHARENDVLKGTLVGALGAATGVLLLGVALSWGPLLRRAGVTGAGDPRSIALMLAIVAALSFLAAPVQNLVSRQIETRADVHALDLTRDPDTFARMQRELSLTNLSSLDPNRWRYVWFFSHPTGPERLALARDWARLHGLPEPGGLADGVSGPG